jgi:hypothetical protein
MFHVAHRSAHNKLFHSPLLQPVVSLFTLVTLLLLVLWVLAVLPR